jgi:hypothetical protein
VQRDGTFVASMNCTGTVRSDVGGFATRINEWSLSLSMRLPPRPKLDPGDNE